MAGVRTTAPDVNRSIRMFIKNLTLINFRNHKNSNLEFDKNLNIIIGPNTSGKSNVLEAIYSLSSGAFIKANLDGDVILYNENFSRIQAVTKRGSEQVDLVSNIVIPKESSRPLKSYEVNKVKRIKNRFLGNFSAVLFSPESLELVTDSPSFRRDYLDFVLSSSNVKYRNFKSVYEKVVRNRNKILERIRDKGVSKVQLEYWDIKILECGTYIQEKREGLFNYLNKEIKEPALNLKLGELQIYYIKSLLTKERLVEYQQKDILAGATLIGPHRDDFEFNLGGRNLKPFGSRGQQRTAVLSLKICELRFLESMLNEKPVLLLDDIFSELDENHRESIIKISKSQQTIITSADKNLVPKSIIKDSKAIILK